MKDTVPAFFIVHCPLSIVHYSHEPGDQSPPLYRLGDFDLRLADGRGHL